MSKREVYGFEIPEGYDWVAVDRDGEVVGFKDKPVFLEECGGSWMVPSTDTHLPSDITVDYKEFGTLEDYLQTESPHSLIYVPDIYPKQSNTEPRDLACFKQVANVIGEEAADIELEKVIKSGRHPNKTVDDISRSFNFDETPQGSEFWWDIFNGDLPAQYKQHVETNTTTNTASLEHLKEAMCEAVGNEQWDLGWDILKVIREHYGEESD